MMLKKDLNYQVERPLPIGNNKKMIGLMKDELGGKIMTEFVGPIPKTFSCLKYGCGRDKKTSRKQKCMIKRRFKFEDYRKCLENNHIVLRLKQRFESEAHNAFTEKVNKIALIFYVENSLQSSNKVKPYAYGTSVGNVYFRNSKHTRTQKVFQLQST